MQCLTWIMSRAGLTPPTVDEVATEIGVTLGPDFDGLLSSQMIPFVAKYFPGHVSLIEGQSPAPLAHRRGAPLSKQVFGKYTPQHEVNTNVEEIRQRFHIICVNPGGGEKPGWHWWAMEEPAPAEGGWKEYRVIEAPKKSQ